LTLMDFVALTLVVAIFDPAFLFPFLARAGHERPFEVDDSGERVVGFLAGVDTIGFFEVTTEIFLVAGFFATEIDAFSRNLEVVEEEPDFRLTRARPLRRALRTTSCGRHEGHERWDEK